jgi:hypothetical protein
MESRQASEPAREAGIAVVAVVICGVSVTIAPAPGASSRQSMTTSRSGMRQKRLSVRTLKNGCSRSTTMTTRRKVVGRLVLTGQTLYATDNPAIGCDGNWHWVIDNPHEYAGVCTCAEGVDNGGV